MTVETPPLASPPDELAPRLWSGDRSSVLRGLGGGGLVRELAAVVGMLAARGRS